MAKNYDYNRKISAKEAQNGFIFILKNKLSVFPSLGREFKMVEEDSVEKEVKVESYPCTCRGPDLPHEHYYIKWEGLNEGDEVKIRKESADIYRIVIS